MFKRIMYRGGAVGALVAAYLVGSLTLGGAFAQAGPTSPQAPPPASSPSGAQQEQSGANEQGESADLAAQAKITADQAKAAALAQFPGASVGKVDLDNENGAVVYSIQLTDLAGKAQDVKVDAATAKVVQTQADGPDGPETGGGAQEGAETQD